MITNGKHAAEIAERPRTRERIVLAARDSFAERGFAGTTVGDLERAAGLSPRSGGLYKHFRSKEEVLHAVFDMQVHEAAQLQSMLELLPLGDIRAELTLLLRWGLVELERERALMRIVLKEGDRFPELADSMRDRIVRPAHALASAWAAARIEAGAVKDIDPAALASLVIGAIVNFRMTELMFGEPIGRIDEQVLVDTIIELVIAPGGAAINEEAAT